MGIERLKMIVAPPSRPLDVPDEQAWKSAELKLTAFPSDYREFIEAYGTGSIDSFIWVYNPATDNANLNVEQQVRAQLAALKEFNESRLVPALSLFPEPSGVLPFGISDNGDLILWKAAGEPDDWTVCVLPSRGTSVLHFTMNMTEFLAGICEGSVRCHAFPNDFPSPDPVFVPLS